MTITQLKYIVAVSTFESFSLAASNCYVSQPTLSMQIQKLEKELDVTIFRRDKQPIRVTDIGEKIIHQAKLILKEKDKLNYLIQVEKGEYVGLLRVAVIPTISSYLLPMVLSRFIKKFPKVEILIDEVTTVEVISGLEQGHFDIGLIALRSNIDNLIVDKLYYEPFVAFLPPGHDLLNKKKLNLDDLKVNDFLLLKEGHCLRDQTLSVCKSSSTEWFAKSNKVVFESGNLETLIKLVEQKFGMTLLPYLAVQYIKDKKNINHIREFYNPVPTREIGLIYNKSFVKAHLLEVLKEEILNTIPQELKINKEGLIIR